VGEFLSSSDGTLEMFLDEGNTFGGQFSFRVNLFLLDENFFSSWGL
jgi:hypothetical protein